MEAQGNCRMAFSVSPFRSAAFANLFLRSAMFARLWFREKKKHVRKKVEKEMVENGRPFLKLIPEMVWFFFCLFVFYFSTNRLYGI